MWREKASFMLQGSEGDTDELTKLPQLLIQASGEISDASQNSD